MKDSEIFSHCAMVFKFKSADGTFAEFPAHKFLIAARSQLFAELLREHSGDKFIEVDDCSLKSFQTLIEYLYLDDIQIVQTIKDCEMLVEILKLAKRHQLPCLLEQCEIQFKTIIKEDFNIPNIPSYN